MRKKWLIGIDEVGRGPLAGPVTVGAVAIPKRKSFKLHAVCASPLRDSKKLNENQRSEWNKAARKHPDIIAETVSIHPKTIDKINIFEATNKAARTALQKLSQKHGIDVQDATVCLDASIDLHRAPQNKYATLTFVKGDEMLPVISLASIVAKVKRDSYMRFQHKKYPEYGFQDHKGYGTKSHGKALRKYGISPIHRLTFLKKFGSMKTKLLFSKPK